MATKMIQTSVISQNDNRIQRFPITLPTASTQATSPTQPPSAQSTATIVNKSSKRSMPELDQSDSDAEQQPPPAKKKGRRPKGSKNKKTIERESAASTAKK
jgi:hypothetical protein